MAGELVVGYDGSECAQLAVRTAAELALGLGTGMIVAFCAEPPQASAGGAGDQRRLLEERGAELLDEAAALVADTGVTVHTIVIDNKPAPGLVALAEQQDARFIVVGTYSERPLAAALVGSTPHKLLHLSNHPVLVVPVPDPDHHADGEPDDD